MRPFISSLILRTPYLIHMETEKGAQNAVHELFDEHLKTPISCFSTFVCCCCLGAVFFIEVLTCFWKEYPCKEPQAKTHQTQLRYLSQRLRDSTDSQATACLRPQGGQKLASRRNGQRWSGPCDGQAMSQGPGRTGRSFADGCRRMSNQQTSYRKTGESYTELPKGGKHARASHDSRFKIPHASIEWMRRARQVLLWSFSH